MRRTIRKKSDMFHRVLALVKKYPAEVPGYVEAVQRLEERLVRLDLLATQQESGDQQARGSVDRKDQLRDRIMVDYLQHLVRIARAALPSDPALRAAFRLPDARLNRAEFVARVRAMLAEAASRQQVFIAEGMAETFVADLEALLTEYLGVMDQQVLAAAQRIGAVAELPEVAKELMGLVRRLDGINRKRWQKNPELLAAWLSAKDIGWPHAKPDSSGSGPGSAPGSGAAGSGESAA